MYFDQSEYDVLFEWGLSGLQALAPVTDVMIIVDVLSFTTCVDLVVGRGGTVYPYRDRLESLPDYAHSKGALFAAPGRRHEAAYSLAPSTLLAIPEGTCLVLPSPNGSTLSLVVAAGERWKKDGGGVASDA